MTSSTAPRRAIWGLVNDGYALVAKTANLTHDEAFELCRVPDIGDPSAYLDQGIAYLRAPKWGHVLARYFTNAERDSAGRASLVYDVVALSDADFATLGNDAFRSLPPLASDRKPERFGELPVQALTPRDEAAEAARLATLLDQVDPPTIATLLGAVLAGDHVLCVAPNLRAETIECLTLLLPPALRTVVTFQAPTVDFPKHAPRLTVAERGHALLVERDWSVVLPRDADDPRLADAISTAERLVALGRNGDRLRRAWSVSGASARTDLTSAVGGALRLDLLHEALRTGDLRRTVLVAARAESSAEQLAIADAIFETATPDLVAAALADVVRGEQRGAWAATHAIASAVAHRREKQSARFATFFTALLDGVREVPRPVGDTTARDVHVLLACAMASIDDLGRFLDVADPDLPWDTAWRDGSARWVKGRSAVARLFDALAARGATYGDAIDGIQAIAGVVPGLTGRARDRAGALALSLVRRTLRDRATLEPPDRLGAMVDGLLRVWTADSSTGQRTAATTELERVLRRFLGVGEPGLGGADPRRLASELSRALAELPDATGDAELIGWIIATLERAHAGGVGEMSVRAVAALLDEQRRLAPRPELPAIVGRVLLHFAAADASFVFRPAWLDVARQADDASRRELLVRALAWVARGYANGRFTIGAFADACVVAGAEGITIDAGTAELLVPHMASAAAERGSATELALLTATVSSVATPAAAEKLSDVLLGAVEESVADTVRMRRLALALHEIERVRAEDRYADARAALRRVLAGQTLGADEERTLRTFLGVDDGTVVGRLLGRLPSLTPRVAAALGDRR
ncbi:MAG TPA: hypothetical protein VM076_16390 [Gemmatimonadaceae bacterium]|nr:hypothetical protein [Gemmatimonadaceae bacterium]